MSGNAATQKGAMTVDEKMLLVEKHHLIHENNAWYSDRENSHKHLIFKDAFFKRTDVIGLLFRINKLCMAVYGKIEMQKKGSKSA